MAEITVAMPAHNAAAFIAHAISSIQQQTDVEWELIVVDDGSTDETGKIVQGFDDPRIRLVCNPTRRGIACCHNQILAESRTPWLAHVDADDFILPGALRKVMQALEQNPRAGQAYCQYYDVDSEGKILPAVLARRNEIFSSRITKGIDYRHDLIAFGMVAGGLRTYPRHVLQELGGFNEALTFASDYEMAVRIVEHYEIAFVPEYLYVRRLHATNTTESMTHKQFRFFWQRYKICRTLERTRQVTFFNQPPYNLNLLLLSSFLDVTGVRRVRNRIRDKLRWIRLPTLGKLYARFVTPLPDGLYEFIVNHGGGFQIEPPRRAAGHAPLRVGYYKWRYPKLSETFIDREVQALRDAGVTLEVFADEPDEVGDSPPVATTHYLGPRERERIARAKKFFARKNWIRYCKIFLFVRLQRYAVYKTLNEDRQVTERALELAYVLEANKITHLHVPWADRTAFTALVAAYLVQIPYSVEARAHDLHRDKSKYGLREKFSNAAFIVTNSDYNARTIETYLEAARKPPLHVIRELFPLAQFQPPPRTPHPEPFRILCVARLIQEKGLVYLLQGCAQLRTQGIRFCCEIIGGPEEPTYTVYWTQLKRLRKQLELEDTVAFTGAQPFDRVLAAYARADLFVLPCVIADNGGRDISPNALIEAMAMGLPVISTQLAAIPEIVEHDVSGILVPPNDAAALADAMARLLRDEPLRRALGSRARARVEQIYDAQKNVVALAALFHAKGV